MNRYNFTFDKWKFWTWIRDFVCKNGFWSHHNVGTFFVICYMFQCYCYTICVYSNLILGLRNFNVSLEYANKERTMTIVEEHDKKVLVFILMKASKHLDLMLIENLLPLTPNFDDSLWKVAISIKEVSLSLLKTKLFLYQIDTCDVKSPLQRWKDHEKNLL